MNDEISKTVAIRLTINGSAHGIIKHNPNFEADSPSRLSHRPTLPIDAFE